MNSKEALEQLEQYITNEKGRLNFFIKLAFGTIKQDLERLEVLEKEKKTREILLENKCLVECDKFFFQELLKGERNIYYKKYIDLQQENEKFKKALNIIKNKCYSLQLSEATDEEYELLKEVLGE